MRFFEPQRLRVSIRTQLIALVMFVALFSLVTLAIVCGVYFTSVFTESRASKFQVAAQLKSIQMEQAFESYRYQIQQLSTKSSIEKALSVRKAGNTSDSTLSSARTLMYQTLQSTNGLIDARLYDLNFETVIEVKNPDISRNASESMLNSLYILNSTNLSGGSLPDGLLSKGYLEGPYTEDEVYYMSLTMAVYTNESILTSESFLGGYLTVVIDASTLFNVTQVSNGSDYSSINFFIPVTPLHNASDLTGFLYAFKSSSMSLAEYNTQYDFDSFKPAANVFLQGKSLGQEANIKNPLHQSVALGYSTVDMTVTTWMVTVEQARHLFVSPTTKLIKIMIGVCIGLAILMCIVTFPLAHYGVRPIIELQKATEAITDRRGLKKKRKRKRNLMSHNLLTTFTYPHIHYKEKSMDSETCNNRQSESTSNHGKEEYNNKKAQSPPYLRGTILPSSSTSARTSFTAGSHSVPSINESFNDGSVTDYETGIVPSLVNTNGLFYDELTELTDAFNAMSLELEKQYTTLEDRVKARTKELEAAKVQADSARQQAEKANEAKTVFIANISHELRTPLNGILGMTSVAMTEEDPKRIQNSLDLIFRSGELLLHILTQLLTFSKNQLDKSKLQKKEFLMIDVALQVYSIFGKTAKDRDVNLIITLKPNFIRDMILFGDSNRIIQVIMNLVSNSLKFTPKDGTVRVLAEVLGDYDEERSKAANYEKVYIKGLQNDIDTKPVTPIFNKLKDYDFADEKSDVCSLNTIESSTYHSIIKDFMSSTKTDETYFNDEEVFLEGDISQMESDGKAHKCHKYQDGSKSWVLRFSVSDTGTGIDDSLQDKIFDAFVQGDQTLSRSHGGTGLGLSICKQFAKLMHGTITLHSKIGEGSTFTFTIPLPQVGELMSYERFIDDKYNEAYLEKKVKFIDSENGEEVSNEEEDVRTMNLANSYATAHENHSASSHRYDALSTYEKPDLITRASTGTAQSHRSSSANVSSLNEYSIPETSAVNGGTSPKAASLPHGASGKLKLKVLVAEDNLVNQEVVKRMLLFEGVDDITLARDGNDAIEFVKESMDKNHAFDLILMDVQMPNLDGLSATKIIRQELKFTGPIVALTAFADKSNEEGCTQAGMSGFLSKPIRRPLLRKVISDANSHNTEHVEVDDKYTG